MRRRTRAATRGPPRGGFVPSARPGSDDAVVRPRRDERGGEIDGLLRGAALPIDRGRGGLHRQPGLQPGGARDVGPLLAELLDAPGHDVLDLGGVDPRACDELRVREREECRGMHVLQGALLWMPTADGRPDRLDDHDVTTLPTHAWRVPGPTPFIGGALVEASKGVTVEAARPA